MGKFYLKALWYYHTGVQPVEGIATNMVQYCGFFCKVSTGYGRIKRWLKIFEDKNSIFLSDCRRCALGVIYSHVVVLCITVLTLILPIHERW
jgi:hypothetical protein